MSLCVCVCAFVRACTCASVCNRSCLALARSLSVSLCLSLSLSVSLCLSEKVLTTNPLVESWGHFPTELQRLERLLHTCAANSSVVLISGDVHFTETTSVHETGQLVELTTSGMTHACRPQVLCRAAVALFGSHRTPRDAVVIDRAFAKLVLSWPESSANDAGGGDGGDGGDGVGSQDGRGRGSTVQQQHHRPHVDLVVVSSATGDQLARLPSVRLANGTVFGTHEHTQHWGVGYREEPVGVSVAVAAVLAMLSGLYSLTRCIAHKLTWRM